MSEAKKSIYQTVNELSLTPYPALALGSTLIANGLTAPVPIQVDSGTSGGSAKFSRSLALTKPSKTSSYAFGAASLLGAWISYDGEPVNAAGFNFAWSTLYLVVNGGSGLKSLVRGKVSPFAISILALGNAGIYGKRFFWPTD